MQQADLLKLYLCGPVSTVTLRQTVAHTLYKQMLTETNLRAILVHEEMHIAEEQQNSNKEPLEKVLLYSG